MAPQRPTAKAGHDHLETQAKRPKKAFSVGPANLPRGLHRRKVQKIKQDLIRKAKVKKSYSKLKEREPCDTKLSIYSSPPPPEEPSALLELHPERQAMLDEPELALQEHADTQQQLPRQRKAPPPRAVPFRKEALLAQQRREENERRQKQFEESNRQRQAKIDERERFRKAMAKARSGGRGGQRKLGRESKVLLERVQRMVGP
ncbi:MAG: hypothetical protein ALECFALPRED_009702 [Alectoria fallacina]|uniref:rRNA-processing protein FYV7 n=1 Tax=Alectoria fallacina TaxID=1903189 RepID=A0A8H3J7M6_9LECA|nr:MAG: hypothetical protein ALECFALPRED_009702 [Alectoria fallacina]